MARIAPEERMRRLRLIALELVVPVALIAVWWWRSADSKSPYFPPLEKILDDFRKLYLWADFNTDVLYSLSHFAVGFAIGTAVGFAIGVALGLSDRTRRNVAPITEFFRAMPIVALIPIALVMVGPGMLLEAGLIALGCNWPVMLNTADGVRGVDPVMVETARSYGLSRRRQIRSVIIPAAMPQVLAGVRVAVGLGVAVMVVANMFAASQGLGAQVALAQGDFQITDSWAEIIMIALVGIVITALYAALHHRLLAWHRGWRASTADA
jgi:ABC-type nitrate/sulfonate/bicarbonate transport system permease component